jgi:molybdopterin converting factor small subunit
MFVKVFIKGFLKDYVKNDSITINVDKNTSVKELEKILNLPTDIPRFCSVNQIKVSTDYIVNENDEAMFVPIVGGGQKKQ